MIARALPAALALLLPLSACGEAPPRPPVAGPEARKAVDDATAAYADCISSTAAKAPPGGVPGTIVDKAVKSCEPAREVLAERVMEFHKIGHPKFSPNQLRAVAEASIDQVEPEMRADAVASYITRSAPNAAANNAKAK